MHLSVRPTSTVLHYADLHADAAAAGRALNVDYILQGNIQRSPGVVTVQLIRVRDAASLQTVSFNEKFTNIFQVEDSLSVFCSGWRGGVAPAGGPVFIPSPHDFATGGVLAGALAVARGFLRVSGLSSRPLEAPQGISLWWPDLM